MLNAVGPGNVPDARFWEIDSPIVPYRSDGSNTIVSVPVPVCPRSVAVWLVEARMASRNVTRPSLAIVLSSKLLTVSVALELMNALPLNVSTPLRVALPTWAFPPSPTEFANVWEVVSNDENVPPFSPMVPVPSALSAPT